MSSLNLNVESIYKSYFKPSYGADDREGGNSFVEYTRIPPKSNGKASVKGIDFQKTINGHEVFLPVEFWKSNELYLEVRCCTIAVSTEKTIVKTAVSERAGTIKEQFSVGDYRFTIKGVLIGDNRTFPDDKIIKLKELYETVDAVELRNAMTELFVTGSRRIVITNLTFPEVHHGSKHHRPFELTCESDYINDLKLPR